MDWLAPLRFAFGRGRDGVLVLVDRAVPGALPLLSRALLDQDPSLTVTADAATLDEAPHGGIVILSPRPQDLARLNLNRTVLSRRALRVALFCDDAAAGALHMGAPDLFDWISRRVECPQVPPAGAVASLRALIRARLVGALYRDDSYGAALSAALPGRQARRLSAGLPYEALLAGIHQGGRDVLCFTEVESEPRLRRARWALAEARWRRPSLFIPGPAHAPGLFILHGQTLALDEATAVLALARRPGLLAALLSLEPDAVALAQALLAHGLAEEHILREVIASADPGAMLAQMAIRAGILGTEDLAAVAEGSASPPLLRGLHQHREVRRLVRERQKEARSRLLAGTQVDAGRAAALAGSLLPGEVPRPPPGPPDGTSLLLVDALLRQTSRTPDARAWLLRCAEAANEQALAGRWAHLFGLTLHADAVVREADAALARGDAPVAADALKALLAAWDQGNDPGPLDEALVRATLGISFLSMGQRGAAAHALHRAREALRAVPEPDGALRVLMLPGDPSDLSGLWLIRAAAHLRRALSGRGCAVLVEPEAFPEEGLALQVALRRPHVLHLCTRGGPLGAMGLGTPDQEDPRPVPPEWLRALIAAVGAPPACAVLDGPGPGAMAQAEALAEALGSALLLPGALSLEEALRSQQAFYLSLCGGSSPATAAGEARRAVSPSPGLAAAPVLLTRPEGRPKMEG